MRAAAAAILALALLAWLGAPAPAQAGCGGVQTAQPKVHRTAGLPPLAIGDSTMLLAMPYLAREGFAVNAHGCREYSEALALLHQLSAARRLPTIVVVALGADGTVTRGDVRDTLSLLGPTRVLVLVTPRELGGGSGSDAETVRAEGRAHPGRIHVLDWVAYASGRGGEWFQPDGLHLTFGGAAIFARFLQAALHVPLPIQSVLLAGRARPSGPGAPPRATAFRLRLRLPDGWATTGRHIRAGVPDLDVATAGDCAYHLRVVPSVSWAAPPVSGADHLRSLIPPGARAAPLTQGRAGGEGAAPVWTAWRAPGIVGADWSLALAAGSSPAGQGFLDLAVSTGRGHHCTSGAAREAERQVLGMLAAVRAAA